MVVKELKNVEILPQSIAERSTFNWAYRYRFTINNHDIAIWGDKTKLEENFAQTKLINECMPIVNSALKGMQKPSILVLNSKEGLVPFSIIRSYASSITAVEDDSDKVSKANEIKDIILAHDLTNSAGNLYSFNSMKTFDVVIDLSGECMSGQIENSTTNKLYTLCRGAVIVLCENKTLSRRLLSNAGFITVLSVNKFLNIGSENQNKTLLIGVKDSSYVYNIRKALCGAMITLIFKKIYLKFVEKFF